MSQIVLGEFVSYIDCCHDKSFQYKIRGQSKPFVDKNLQLQLPEWDAYSTQITPSSSSSIYSHYINFCPSFHLFPEINEAEIHQSIKETELSYKAWKEMHDQIVETSKAL